MSDVAIRVENLSKQYRIGAVKRKYRTLRDQLVDWMGGWFRRGGEHKNKFIWALEDVSFDVRQGEVLGIVGHNGSGKSTLLKILSGITEPTRGRAELYGRVGSLLEVGTGFHQELTGRENVYLNGSILGMSRTEIDRKFDEIVEFSGVEKFIDTTVKFYSSGMSVRLAFAVAAHLEPEILLIDEVLAVGDAAFQKKSLGKMDEVARSGRTVLFVSHNMTAVENLCPRSIWLSDGKLVGSGDSSTVIESYLTAGSRGQSEYVAPQRERSTPVYFTHARLIDGTGRLASAVPMGGSLTVELGFDARETIKSPAFSVRLTTLSNDSLVAWRTRETAGELPPLEGRGMVRLHVENLNLLPGRYYLTIGLSDPYRRYEVVENALKVEVTPRAIYAEGSGLTSLDGEHIYTPCSWEYAFD